MEEFYINVLLLMAKNELYRTDEVFSYLLLNLI